MPAAKPRSQIIKITSLDASPTFGLAAIAHATSDGAQGVQEWAREEWLQKTTGDWWFRFVHVQDFSFAVCLRFGEDRGRPVVTGLHVETGGEQLTTKQLHKLSIPVLLERLGEASLRQVPPARRSKRGRKTNEALSEEIVRLWPLACVFAPGREIRWLLGQLADLGHTPSPRTLRRRIADLGLRAEANDIEKPARARARTPKKGSR